MTDHHVDARGLRCPLPVLRLRKAAAGLPEGAMLTLVADDPAAAADVPAFAAEQGWTVLLADKADDGSLRWRIRL